MTVTRNDRYVAAADERHYLRRLRSGWSGGGPRPRGRGAPSSTPPSSMPWMRTRSPHTRRASCSRRGPCSLPRVPPPGTRSGRSPGYCSCSAGTTGMTRCATTTSVGSRWSSDWWIRFAAVLGPYGIRAVTLQTGRITETMAEDGGALQEIALMREDKTMLKRAVTFRHAPSLQRQSTSPPASWWAERPVQRPALRARRRTSSPIRCAPVWNRRTPPRSPRPTPVTAESAAPLSRSGVALVADSLPSA